ncbi:MAG: hypothetical protein BroJett014_11130 [Planctomycetota bacterium]|nr:MAG: hypothetical protein BroJett014_11130 [Planctomycetota bacterium]
MILRGMLTSTSLFLILLCAGCVVTSREALTTSDLENAVAKEPATFDDLLRILRECTTKDLSGASHTFVAKNPREIKEWLARTERKFEKQIIWKIPGSSLEMAYAIRQVEGIVPDVQTFSAPRDLSWAFVVDETDRILGWIRP